MQPRTVHYSEIFPSRSRSSRTSKDLRNQKFSEILLTADHARPNSEGKAMPLIPSKITALPADGERATPFWRTRDRQTIRLYLGDVLDVLKKLPSNQVQMVVTSPPYWGLRDYGTAKWEGGDAKCDHLQPRGVPRSERQSGPHGVGKGGSTHEAQEKKQYVGECKKCGATRIDSQIGSERTPEEYVAKTVEVFREVRRVLRNDGTLWLNLGDTYGGGGNIIGDGVGGNSGKNLKLKEMYDSHKGGKTSLPSGNLVGIPWRVALALQADGWILRQDIIWAKPSPMPESVRNRCTKAHEYIFLLTARQGYYYDTEAIKEAGSGPVSAAAGGNLVGKGVHKRGDGFVDNGDGRNRESATGCNKRSVWTVSSQGYEGAHFATFPPKLIEPCILAGTSEYGACARCGSPWRRVVETEEGERASEDERGNRDRSMVRNRQGLTGSLDGKPQKVSTKGWEPTCTCGIEEVRPCRVLDPFMGSGTTALVSLKHGRWCWGIDLSRTYLLNHAIKRIQDELAVKASSNPLLLGEGEGDIEIERVTTVSKPKVAKVW